MSRLTKVKSIHNNEPEFYEANIELYPESMGYEHLEAEMDCINKLGELEDIEEELGCPLEVVFKALISGIIVENDEDFIEIGYSDREDKYVYFSTEEIYLKNWQSHGIEETTNCFQITFGDDG